MTTYNILSRHTKLSDAVAAAGIDLSYNEPLAREDLRRNDRDTAIKSAFVLERDGEKSVWFEFHCDIKLFNRYTPFHSTMHDGKFSAVRIEDTKVEITKPIISRKIRRTIAEFGLLVSA